MVTKRLYDDNAYLIEFDAVVVECNNTKESNKKGIVLNQTAFFPEQGGQTCDRGFITINDREYAVIDVQINHGIISHVIEADESFEIGVTAFGRIDFEHRFSNMQNHTGEHIFTGISHTMFGCDNVGFHLSDNTVSIDLNKKLSDEQIREIEKIANQKISQNHKINCYYPSKEELSEKEYRCKSGVEGDVRLVEIEGIDLCACCAPHVATTSEVGALIVTGWINYKGGVRIEILCGNRALDYIRESLDIINVLKTTMKCSPAELAVNIEAQIQKLKTTEYELAQVKTAQLISMLDNISSDQNDVILFIDGMFDGKTLREGVNKLLESHKGMCAIFAGDDDEYQFNIGMSIVSEDLNCNMIAQKLRTELFAKCGGTNEMITGKVVASQDSIYKVLSKENYGSNR